MAPPVPVCSDVLKNKYVYTYDAASNKLSEILYVSAEQLAANVFY